MYYFSIVVVLRFLPISFLFWWLKYFSHSHLLILFKFKQSFNLQFQVVAVFLIDLSGVLVHYYEKDFDTKFDYPLKGDIRKYMEQLRLGQELEQVKISNI